MPSLGLVRWFSGLFRRFWVARGCSGWVLSVSVPSGSVNVTASDSASLNSELSYCSLLSYDLPSILPLLVPCT